MSRWSGRWLAWATLLAALLLSAGRLPMDWPDWLAWLRPAWVLLAVCFWAMARSRPLGLFGAWLTGLCYDAMVADPLGLNAALFAFATYAAGQFSQRLRMYAWVQQCALAFAVVLACNAVRHVAHGFPAVEPSGLVMLVPALTSAAAWPAVRLALQGLCRRFHIE